LEATQEAMHLKSWLALCSSSFYQLTTNNEQISRHLTKSSFCVKKR
jgi:hypothetical protein